MQKKTTFGIIVGNRGFFPDAVARDGRIEILATLHAMGFDTVCLKPEDTKFGTVESYADAKACADLFHKDADRIDGILVSLPNFGDERGVADAIRMSGLSVPVLIHAYPDELDRFAIGQRRDGFCGKFSVCANLKQHKIRFSLTTKHVEAPSSSWFKNDVDRFGATCRVVRGLKNSRFGAIGLRPASFNSVRFSEKLLEEAGITIDVIDMVDVLGRANRLSDSDGTVQSKLTAIRKYANVGAAPASSLLKMAKFGVVIDNWVAENDFAGTAVQCWTGLQEYFGITPCTLMSMMGESLKPSACEVDVPGVVAMYTLQLASGKPSAIVDWNNNYGDEEDKCVLFHCSNYPKDFYEEAPHMDDHAILGMFFDKANTWGALQGRIKPGPCTLLRMSTDDQQGKLIAYVTEGQTTPDPARTWGGIGVVHIPNLERLLHIICDQNFEHHVSINLSKVGLAVADALKGYLGWEVCAHEIGASASVDRARVATV